MKINIKASLYTLALTSRCKLYATRYKEVKHIFGVENKAIDLKSCVYAYDMAQKGFKRYNKYGYCLEAAYQNILYRIYNYIINRYPNPSLEEILYTYCYIVRSGYLSIDGQFKFLYPDYELEMRRGLSVMTGKSVCKNIGCMLTDLLVLFNIQAINIVTDRVTTDSEEQALFKGFYYLKEDKENDDQFRSEYTTLKDNNPSIKECWGNHYEVIVQYNNKWYLLDPTSICLYDITKEDTGYPILDVVKLWSLIGTGEYDLKFTCYMYRLLSDKFLKMKISESDIATQRKTFETCEKDKEKLKTLRKNVLGSITYINDFLSQD